MPSALPSLPTHIIINPINHEDMEKQIYKVFTDKGSWQIEAADRIEAFRLALYYSWRDGEVFRYMESPSERLALHLCAEDRWGLYKIAIP